jgi:hypothetical protein
MTAARQAHMQSARRGRAPRRPACSTTARTRVAPNTASTNVTPDSSDGLKLIVKVIPLPDPDSNPLRAQQLAVIVKLLRRAATLADSKGS